MPGRSFCAVACAALVLSFASLGAAQRGAGHSASARQADGDYDGLIREALSEFNALNYAEARALFERAHALKPNARTLRGLGITAFELKRYVQALHDLEAALEETRNPLTEKQRRDVQDLIVKARRFVGKIKLELAPEGATVLLDGRASTSTALVLDLGEHQLSVRAEGYREQELKLVIDGGEDTTQRVELVRLDLSPQNAVASAMQDDRATAAKPEPVDRASSGSVFGKWWFWTVAGVVVAGAVVGTALALSGGSTTKVEPLTTANTPPGAHLQAAMVQ
jgi:tetratricopeptide (TPR) repeat protein